MTRILAKKNKRRIGWTIVCQVIQMYCRHLLLNVPFIACQHLSINNLRKIFLPDVVCGNIVYCGAKTRHCVEGGHIGSPALHKDTFFSFSSDVAAGTNANKGSSAVTDRRKQ